MTNGRLQAGAMSATDPKNCAFIDITSEDTDTNGDLFHNKFYARLDERMGEVHAGDTAD